MAESSIPLDMLNPGQVFACLGFLEAADVLLGDAEGGFDWSDESDVKFRLQAAGEENPFKTVLEFLSKSEIVDIEPAAWPGAHSQDSDRSEEFPTRLKSLWDNQKKTWKRTALPIQVRSGDTRVVLNHWADGSSRNTFKLYSGNRSALGIATAMVAGTRAKPKTRQNIGDLETKGVAALWDDDPVTFIKDPFGVTPMNGSFNFDPRGAWTAIDAGYSPNDQDDRVAASPVVELLAAWGLENARPDEFETRKVRYAAWGISLPPILARAALCGGIPALPLRRFRFELNLSGKNKVVTFAELETAHE
jgi:CRISPR-associated protein Csb3